MNSDSVNPKILVRFKHVDKSFDGETLVIKDLNLDIFEGEFLTLLGPSGSGKTTTLMMLAGFETPTQGEIFIENRSIGNIPPHKRGKAINNKIVPFPLTWNIIITMADAAKTAKIVE